MHIRKLDATVVYYANNSQETKDEAKANAITQLSMKLMKPLKPNGNLNPPEATLLI